MRDMRVWRLRYEELAAEFGSRKQALAKIKGELLEYLGSPAGRAHIEDSPHYGRPVEGVLEEVMHTFRLWEKEEAGSLE